MSDRPDSTLGPTRHLRIFLCHSSADKPAVRDLYLRLKADGFEPWLDEEDLLPGQDWQREIPRAVRASDVVIVCLSHGSVNRAGYIQKEIKFALDAADEKPEDAIFIIPLRLEECKVPDRLKRWQWVNLFDPNGYKKLLRTFATQLGANSLPPTIVAAQSEEIVVSRSQNSETVQSSSMVSTQSGGVDLKANDVAIGQDAVGRDKVVSAGGHIIHAEPGSTVVINERPTSLAAEHPANSEVILERPAAEIGRDQKMAGGAVVVEDSGDLVGRDKITANIHQFTLSQWIVIAGVAILTLAIVTLASTFIFSLLRAPTPTPTATLVFAPAASPRPSSSGVTDSSAALTPPYGPLILPSGHRPPISAGGAAPEIDGVPDLLRVTGTPAPIPTPRIGAPTRIKIPAINVDAQIVFGDGWEQLKKGVGQRVGTAEPGTTGNLVLSAHNDVFGEIFRHLDRLVPGDEIEVFSREQRYRYVVTRTQLVQPDQVSVMIPTTKPILTLISCYPYLIDDQRIVVFADFQQ